MNLILKKRYGFKHLIKLLTLTLCLYLTVPLHLFGDTPSKKLPSSKKASSLSNKGEFLIGVLYWSMNIPGQVAMRKGLEKEAQSINTKASSQNTPHIRLLVHVAGDGVEGMENQIIQMQSLIEKKVDLIIVQPTDIAALSLPLKLANQTKIPVVSYDQHILEGELACFVTSNNYQAGFLDGEYVSAKFPSTQKLKTILIEYPHVSSTVQRVDGFIDALESYGQSYEIVKTYRAVEPVSGKKAGQEILKDFPKKGSIDLIFAVNDGGGLSVIEELEKAGRDEIFFASVDGDPISVNKIANEGISKIDSAQFCGEMGAEAMRVSYRLLLGEKIAQKVLIPVFPITIETIKNYKGWTAPIPKPFKKPWISKEPFWEGKILRKTISER